MIDAEAKFGDGGVRDRGKVVVLRVSDEPSLWPLRGGLVVGAFYEIRVDDGVNSDKRLTIGQIRLPFIIRKLTENCILSC